MRTRLLHVFAVAALAAGLAAAATAAGPTPGFSQPGVISPNGKIRYVAVSRGTTTFVKAVRVLDGRMLRHTTLRGVWGVPLVAFDGTAEGVTRDGKRLLLETEAGQSTTRFAFLSTKTLKVLQSFTLPGTWAYDAMSADAKTVYLIQLLASTDSIRYLVRAYDVSARRLVAGAIADKSEPGAMTGFPLSRAVSKDGKWAYTLYQRSNAQPFIHALNTRDRVAICIDLDWKGDSNNLGAVRLTLSADETQLVIRADTDGKAVMTVPAPR
jgi:hypothetical protein